MTPEDRVGIVIFDSTVSLVLPLTPLGESTSIGKVDQSLARLDYTGRYTFSAEAIERAHRELKDKGRAEAIPVVVFLTDGLIDTGDPQRDRDKRAWLTGPLLDEMKKRGERVYGMALGPQADFQLVQTLGQGTNTGYGEIKDAAEIQARIEELQRILAAGVPAVVAAQSGRGNASKAPEVVVVQGAPNWSTVLIVSGFVLALVAIAWLARGKLAGGETTSSGGAPALAVQAGLTIPGACLVVPEGLGRAGETAVELDSKETWIGTNSEGTALCVLGDQISANHFRIVYDDMARSFCAIDNSANGTWLWKAAAREGAQLLRLEREKPARLSDGDRIVLPGFGREKALEFHLTSKYAPDRPAGATRLVTAAAFLKAGRAEYPILSFTLVGFNEAGTLAIGPGTPVDSRLLIERLTPVGDVSGDTYHLSCQASGVGLMVRRLNLALSTICGRVTV